LSAATQVEGIPEIFNVSQSQGFHFLETGIDTGEEKVSLCNRCATGSKSVAGKRTVYVGTWENRTVPKRSH